MSIFIQGENYLEYHNAGEILRIISWGENSFRVISVPSGSLNLECSALLPQDSDAEIQIGGGLCQHYQWKNHRDTAESGRSLPCGTVLLQ